MVVMHYHWWQRWAALDTAKTVALIWAIYRQLFYHCFPMMPWPAVWLLFDKQPSVIQALMMKHNPDLVLTFDTGELSHSSALTIFSFWYTGDALSTYLTCLSAAKVVPKTLIAGTCSPAAAQAQLNYRYKTLLNDSFWKHSAVENIR